MMTSTRRPLFWGAVFFMACVPLASAQESGWDEGSGVADGSAAIDTQHACYKRVPNEDLYDVLLASECPNYKRANPFFGFTSLTPRLALTLGVIAFVYLLSIAFFKGRVSGGGSAVSAFVVSIATILVLGLVISFLSFADYTWPSDWCECAYRPETGSTLQLGAAAGVGQVKWLWWILAAVSVVLLILVARVSISVPRHGRRS